MLKSLGSEISRFSFLFMDHYIGRVALILNPCFEKKENGVSHGWFVSDADE